MSEVIPTDPLQPQRSASRAKGLAVWAFGVVLLGALVAVVLHRGEIVQFARIAESAKPLWLLPALAAQGATYASAAGCWWIALRGHGQHVSYAGLVPLSMAKLFTDQAVPTGGLSGSMLVVGGLRRRGVPAPLALEVMLVALVTYYAAYLAAVLGSLAVLWVHHEAGPLVWMTTAAFAVIAVGLPAAILWLRRRAVDLPAWIARLAPGLADFAAELRKAPTDLLRRKGLLARETGLQFAVFLCDAITLWAVFHALGQPAAFWVAFAGFVTGSVAATLGPAPLGLGTFEAGTVAMLAVLGVPVETALAATLLFRGLTFWLPMLPGLWLVRREMRGYQSR